MSARPWPLQGILDPPDSLADDLDRQARGITRGLEGRGMAGSTGHDAIRVAILTFRAA